MDTREIQISDFNYALPEERIAKYPLPERDGSKLLIYDRGVIKEDRFRALPGYLPQGALMVFNNTRVIQARLHFAKETGAQIEIFLLEPASPEEYQENFVQREGCAWYCLVGNLKKWKEGTLRRTVEMGGRTVELSATRGGTHGTSHCIEFKWTGGASFAELLEALGELPIPPYLNREAEESDKRTYQTVYSKVEGSVAAPTAGLHFTERVLAELDAKGIDREEVTLHVGAGTFKPVKSAEIGGHDMHSEHIAVRRETIEKLIAHGGRAIAVGTTSVRTLESLYYLGEAVATDPDRECLHVAQWVPYEGEHPLSTTDALRALLGYMDRHQLAVLHATTQIIIAPGYRYHIVACMVTNFHQPQSTLLLLVSAFLGGDWRSIYTYALGHDFRFLSYGDSSLLIPKEGETAETTEKEDAKRDCEGELFPIVDEEGRQTGSATRGECHGGSMLLHPVVHLHVFNSRGELYLQKRPAWKDIQPGKWDTAVGGHVDLGEDILTALRREAREELGIEGFEPHPLPHYVFQSRRERELVYPFRTVWDGPVHPSDETDGGRFWPKEEIEKSLGTGILTPNFEQEWERIQRA